MKLHTKMLLGLLTGALLGIVAHLTLAGTPILDGVLRYVTIPVGQVFLRLLFMLVIPLIVTALALGVSGLGDLKSLGRVGLKTLVYTVVVSAIAVLLGVGLVNLIEPGKRMSPELRERVAAGINKDAVAATTSTAPKSGMDLLVQMVPDNPMRAMASGDMLGVMVFALLLGIGIALTREGSAAVRSFEEALQGLYDITMRLIGIVIGFAPYGVAALLFTLTAQLGYQILQQLLIYVFVVVLALLIHQFVIYSLAVRLFGGMSPLEFFRHIQPAMLTAFSTASSNATLPTAIRVADENLKLPRHVARFVLTIGSTANQNGTALFEGVTVLFLAQFYGIDLSLAQQTTVVLICILGGIGTAGVPAGSIPVVALILGMVGVPKEGIGLILGVDRFLDMCRTTINVSGDLAAAVVVSRGEGEPRQVSGQ